VIWFFPTDNLLLKEDFPSAQMLVKMQPCIYFFYRFDLLIQEIKIKSSFAKITVTKPKKKTNNGNSY